jgi:RimJ/RimL family protein N-acetyltransferase
MKDLFRGELVRLTAEAPEDLAAAFARWNRDTEYARLLDLDPMHMWSAKKMKEYIEKDMEKDRPEEYFFQVRVLAEDKLIGFVGLFPIWEHGNAWVGIGLGERDYWGRGFGTDAMRLILRYGFMELGLHRVTLDVFEYNPRAIRSYEKAGFRVEGHQRQVLNRNGKRWNVIEMGILREEWLQWNPSGSPTSNDY